MKRNPFNDSVLYPVDAAESVQEGQSAKGAASWVGLVLSAVFAVIVSGTVGIEFSAFGFLLAKAVTGLCVIVYVDKYIFRHVETWQEIRDGNVAAALYFVGLCLLVAAAIFSS